MICIGCGDSEPNGLQGVRFKHISYTLCGECHMDNFYAALAGRMRSCPNCGQSLLAESTICRHCRANDDDWENRVNGIIRRFIRSNQRTTIEFCPSCRKKQKHAHIFGKQNILLCVECGNPNPKGVTAKLKRRFRILRRD